MAASRAPVSTGAALLLAATIGTASGYSSVPITPEPVRALLVVDVQDCFLQNSTTLPVADSDRILPLLNDLRTQTGDFFSVFIRSQDYHPKHHISFGPTHGLPGFYNAPFGIKMMCTQETSPDSCCPMLHVDHCPLPDEGCPQPSDATDPSINKACEICFPDGPTELAVNPECKEIYQAMWPDHCRSPFENGDGGFPEELIPRDDDVILRKGQAAFIDGYSVFQDNALFGPGAGFDGGFDFNLHEYLQSKGVTQLYVTGLAYDFCVSWSSKDAAALGYEVFLVEDASAGIFPDSLVLTEREVMLSMGVTMTDADAVVSGSSSSRRRRSLAANKRESTEAQLSALEEAGVKMVKVKDILTQSKI